MKASQSKNNIFKRIITNREITKGKLLRSLLTGFSVPFLLLLSAGLSVYFSNSAELGFGLADILPMLSAMSVLAFAGITLVLLLTKKWLHNLLFSLCAGLVICAYTQTMITTFTFKGLPGDGNTLPPSRTKILLNLILWGVIFIAVIWFCVISKRKSTGHKIASFLMCLTIIMQSVALVPSAVNYTTNAVTNKNHVYLSTKNMFQVSGKKNVIVFILDRFDMMFYERLEKANPEVFEKLDGFTLYEDNVSKYPRTFPAITYLVTGEEFDAGSETQKEYLNDAFENSVFLQDLERNNYNINLYIPHFNAYNRTTKFSDAVTNAVSAENYKIVSPLNFAKRFLTLSSYFWLPDALKSNKISSTTLNKNIRFTGEHPEYVMNISSDADVYAQYRESGLSVQNDKNNYTFLHLRGCHDPLSIDENGVYQPDGNVNMLQQMLGAFGFINEYLAELKSLGLYEDATIIITGDHGALATDTAEYEKSILTTLLIKESGESGAPLKRSSAPVSQDNFLATIIKSEGIETETDYGQSFNEVPEDGELTRTHHFIQLNELGKKDTVITYEIKGLAKDFENWTVTDRKKPIE